MTKPEFQYVLDTAPEHDTEWLLSICLLILQRHDEVSHTAGCAVIVHVLLRKRKVFTQASLHSFVPHVFRYGEVHFPIDWVCIFITQVWLCVIPVRLSVTHNWYQKVANKQFVQRGAITPHIQVLCEWISYTHMKYYLRQDTYFQLKRHVLGILLALCENHTCCQH